MPVSVEQHENYRNDRNDNDFDDDDDNDDNFFSNFILLLNTISFRNTNLTEGNLYLASLQRLATVMI